MNTSHINFQLPDLKLPIVTIIGPPGAGKTAVGKQLADSLGWDFYDTDALIENATALKIAEIFSNDGEKSFRLLESNLVKYISALTEGNHIVSKGGGTIISCGGGLPVPSDNFAHLAKWGKMLCLQAPLPTLMERVSRVKDRPLLNPTITVSDQLSPSHNSERLSRLSSLVEERKAVYARADYQIDTANRSIEDIAIEIRELLKL